MTPMRILTIGAKPEINHALASRDELDVWALSNTSVDRPQSYRSLAYDLGSKLSLRSIRLVRDAMHRSQPDLVHAFYPRPLAHAVLAATSLRSRVPIVSFRGVTSVPKRWSPDEWITYLSPRIVAHACESAAVVDSLVAAGVPRVRCPVVHNCPATPPAPLTRDQARQKLGIASDAFVVMMVANMRRCKGADLLLKAALACRELPKIQFVLAGRVMDREIERLAVDPQLQGIVQLTGYRRDVRRVLSAADLFVMPSRAEALCVALIEAMTAGICPIVSDAGGMKEAVRHRRDGLVFPSDNIAALAEAIRTLYADREQLAAYANSAKARAEGHFGCQAIAARIAAMYTSVLRGAIAGCCILAA